MKKHGYDVSYFPFEVSHRVESYHYGLIRDQIEKVKPQLIAFSCYETVYDWVSDCAAFVKKTFGIPIIIGGAYPTLNPAEVVLNDNFNYVCIGEGEYPLFEVCQALEGKRDIAAIRNIWLRDANGQIIRNPVRPLIENLDEIPFADRDIVDTQAQINREVGDKNIKVLAGRGCPYNCTYCSNLSFRRIYPNAHKYVRIRSVNNVIEELVMLKKRYVFDSIGFYDDNLTLFPQWLDEFVQAYKEKVNMPFYCASRVERSTPDVLKKLKDAGCYMILLGVETGDEEFRKKYLRRHMSNELIKKVFRSARDLGIYTWAFNMVGMPYERRQSVWRTIFFNFQIRPSFSMTSIYYPFKGTELGDICHKNGWVNFEKRKKIGSIAEESVLNHPYMSAAEIKFYKLICVITPLCSKVFLRALVTRVKVVIKTKLRNAGQFIAYMFSGKEAAKS